MLFIFARWMRNLCAASVRGLWRGSLATRLRIVLTLAALAVVAGGVVGPAAAEIFDIALVAGIMLAIYGLALRGR